MIDRQMDKVLPWKYGHALPSGASTGVHQLPGLHRYRRAIGACLSLPGMAIATPIPSGWLE